MKSRRYQARVAEIGILLCLLVLGACIQDPMSLSYDLSGAGEGDVSVVRDVVVANDADASNVPELPSFEDIADVEDVRGDVVEEVEEVDVVVPPLERVSAGLMLYYPFTEGAGLTSADQSQAVPPLDLTIEGRHRWLDEGGVQFLVGDESTVTGRSRSQRAERIGAHMVGANPFSVEVWVTIPSMIGGSSGGPGRVFALSRGGTNTWGNDYFVVASYSDGGFSAVGAPILAFRFYNNTVDMFQVRVDPPVETAVHYVFVFDGTYFRLYQDGVQIAQEMSSLDFTGWSEFNRVRVGNAAREDRQFQGGIHLVAMYDRALSQAEIDVNYEVRW